MTAPSPDLVASQARATRALCLFAWAHPPVLAAAVWAAGGPVLAVAALALALAALAEAARRLGPPEGARLAEALALVGQAAALTGGLAGHPWQVDTHMHFFAVLATLAWTADSRAILAGAGAIALHHLSLNLALPALVYPGGADLGRTLMHAGIVVIETAVLVIMVEDRRRLDADAAAARRAAEAEAERAREADAAAREAAARDAERRAAMLAELDAAFGEVVAAGRAGDLSRRLDRRFEEPALDRLSTNLDGLFEELEAVFAEMEAHLDALAAGDFSAEIRCARDGRFEAARVKLNATAGSLGALVGGVAEAVGRTRAGADEIEDAAEQGARRAETAAASLQETAAAMEEIASSFSTTAGRLTEAERMAGDITARTRAGAGASEEAVAAVGRIESSSQRISDIISVIDSIAFQTNLLALNAAVEAARAGEAGKGFAVVASEVRTLAQRSSEAARDIAELIKESESHVSDGVRLVRNAGAALSEISEGAGALADAVADIAAAGREQSQGVSEVNAAVAQLDSTTQENAAAAEASSASARRLRGDVDSLEALVARMSRDSAGAAPARAA